MTTNFELIEDVPCRLGRPAVASKSDELVCPVEDEEQLAALCFSLLPPWAALSQAEHALARATGDGAAVASLRLYTVQNIRSGADPLGEWFTALRSSELRRTAGAVYTPNTILDPMIDWLRAQGTPVRVVDPGAGSGRFVVAAGSAFPDAQLIAVENDPLAALVLRTNLHLHGMASRAEVVVADYREIELPAIKGVTAFVGNPPYVRAEQVGELKGYLAATYPSTYHGTADLYVYFYEQGLRLLRSGGRLSYIVTNKWLRARQANASF